MRMRKRFWVRWLTGVLGLAYSLAFTLYAAGTAAPAKPLISNSACMECHGDKTLTTTNASGKEISVFVDLAKLSASVHKTNNCASCHADITEKHPDDNVAAKPANCTGCHAPQTESYDASVHGIALKKGHADAATCSDCHDGHTILPPTSPQSPLHFSRLAQTCGACHDLVARDVAEGVHGKAVAAGHRDAPTCTDCHSEHKIVGLKADSPLKIAADVCSNCHASERLNTKYKLPADRVKTFFESYHGLAAQYGSTVAANCGSCHGYHKVLPSSDPRSTIHTNNLVATCGKCHPGATANFAQSKVHVDADTERAGADLGGAINWWVRRLYIGLIVVVIGGMLAHNGLSLFRKVKARYQTADFSVVRMDFSQRVQHFLLGFTFVVLAVTGFALKFPDSWIARMMGSNEPFRRWSHRIAGVAMLLVGAYHIFYILKNPKGRKLVRDFFPIKKDIADVFQNVRFLLGLGRDKAKIGRFGYAEKMEYWAVVWGTIIMGGTGLMIWLKMDVTRWLPRWAVDVALTIHYYEAILACLAIVVWHFYHVIFDPDVYPMNTACWNGRVSKHWLAEEHSLESAEGAEPGQTLAPEEGRVAAVDASTRRAAPGANGNGHKRTGDFSI